MKDSLESELADIIKSYKEVVSSYNQTLKEAGDNIDEFNKQIIKKK